MTDPVELYPIHLSSIIAPSGQRYVIEPQVEIRDVTERLRIQRVTGIVAYREQGPLSTMHWVARC